jgi:hypothetical protein
VVRIFIGLMLTRGELPPKFPLCRGLDLIDSSSIHNLQTTHYEKTLLITLTLSMTFVGANAATVFITNNFSPKSLASNQGDAGTGLTNGGADDGNNNGLDQDAAGNSTVLALSADDGGGAITFTTSDVSSSNKLVMDDDSMGHGNDKWGNSQNWTFSLDQTISFDALTFKTINETMTLSSSAWVNDADATGSNWSFNGTDGTFDILGGGSGPGTYDFTSAGVSNVASGTSITFGFLTSAGGGEELSSFTISVIPEPSVALLGSLGLLALLRRRR